MCQRPPGSGFSLPSCGAPARTQAQATVSLAVCRGGRDGRRRGPPGSSAGREGAQPGSSTAAAVPGR